LNLQATKHEIEEKRFKHCYKITVNHRIIITSISSSAKTEHTNCYKQQNKRPTTDGENLIFPKFPPKKLVLHQ
jgi:hypothetical protein